VRVSVLRVPPGESSLPAEEVRVDASAVGEAPGRLLTRSRLELRLMHTKTLQAVRAWTDKPRSEAGERLRAPVEAAGGAGPRPLRRRPAGAAAPLPTRAGAGGQGHAQRPLLGPTGSGTRRTDRRLPGAARASRVIAVRGRPGRC